MEAIVQANKESGLSPGIYTEKYAAKCAKERKRHQTQFCRPSAKRRRLILKQERSVTQGAQEALEGLSYQPDIGFESGVDVEKLPDAVPRGDFKPVDMSGTQPTLIAMDLETTDLIRRGQIPHITQIAAKVVGGNSTFNMYVQPKVPISHDAQQTTGISTVGDRMFVGGVEIEAVNIKTAMDSFLSWLERFSNVVITAHNGRRFDFPVLVFVLSSLNKFDRFSDCVSALFDSLSLFRKVYPGRSTYKQETLAFEILNITYNAHDAGADVFALSHLVNYTTLLLKI